MKGMEGVKMKRRQDESMDKAALLEALGSEEGAKQFSDLELHALIEAEFSKPDTQMDCALLDACCRLLERRQSPFGERAIARSEKKGFGQFKRFMRKSRALETGKGIFRFKPLAAALLLAAMVLAPMLIPHRDFKIIITPDEQDYLIMGMRQNQTGVASAAGDKKVKKFRNVKPKSIEEIPAILGYDIRLPGWMPEGLKLSEIDIVQTIDFDEVLLAFEGDSKRISVEITYYESREGSGESIPQDGKGKTIRLNNGESIYLAHNMQSIWGLHQSSMQDYFIDAIGFDEDVIVKLFNSIGEKHEEK